VAAVIALFAVSAALVITMESGILEGGPDFDPTPTTTVNPTNTTVSTATVTTTIETTLTTTTPACGVVMEDFETDRFTYSHLTDKDINCSLLVRNALDVSINSTSLRLFIEQNKTAGAGAPDVQQFLKTDTVLGQLSLGPGNSTYLNFSFSSALFESTIGNYTLEATLTIDGVTCTETLFTDYRVI